MKNKSIIKYILIAAFVLITGGAVTSVSVKAQEETNVEVTELSQFVTALEKMDAKEAPQKDAEVIFSFEAGATIFVTGETESGWYSVFYQGQTGYIDVNEAKDKMQINEIDVSALDKEMEAEEALGKLIVEEAERYRAEAKRSKLWGTVIVLLIIGILAIGIISTVQAERAKRKEEELWESDTDAKARAVAEEIQDEALQEKTTEQEDDIWDLDKE